MNGGGETGGPTKGGGAENGGGAAYGGGAAGPRNTGSSGGGGTGGRRQPAGGPGGLEQPGLLVGGRRDDLRAAQALEDLQHLALGDDRALDALAGDVRLEVGEQLPALQHRQATEPRLQLLQVLGDGVVGLVDTHATPVPTRRSTVCRKETHSVRKCSSADRPVSVSA
nr:hypothetical protein GCM10020092_104180 [Actinoplanes digitatis]